MFYEQTLFVHACYSGVVGQEQASGFHGWQAQKEVPTQQVVVMIHPFRRTLWMERRHPTRHIPSANVFQPTEYAVTVVVLTGWAGDSIVCSHLVKMVV